MKVLAGSGEINYLAVLVAAIAGFGIGALWYAPPVFGKAWMRLTGRTPDKVQGEATMPPMIMAFIATVIGVFALALFIGRGAGAGTGTLAGLVAGVGIATTALVINGLFEARPVTLMAINSGYLIVVFTVAGAILGAW